MAGSYGRHQLAGADGTGHRAPAFGTRGRKPIQSACFPARSPVRGQIAMHAGEPGGETT
jgi:hypothetical protein